MKMHVMDVGRSIEPAHDGSHYEGHAWTLCGWYAHLNHHAERREDVSCKRCAKAADRQVSV